MLERELARGQAAFQAFETSLGLRGALLAHVLGDELALFLNERAVVDEPAVLRELADRFRLHVVRVIARKRAQPPPFHLDDPFRQAVEQVAVVRNDDRPAGMSGQELFQPTNGVDVR